MKPTATGLNDYLKGFDRYATSGLRSILGMGLYLTKAANHFNQQGKRTDKLIPTVGISSNEGFLQWLEEQIISIYGFSRATLYNYMVAAKAVGLTLESTEEDIAALDLTGKKASDLYKLGAEKKPDPPSFPPITAEKAAEQLWLPLWKEADRYAEPEGQEAKALWKLPMVSADPSQPSLGALEIKLRATLDLIKEVKEARQKSRR